MPRRARKVLATDTEIERARSELLHLGDCTTAEFIRQVARYDGTVLEEDGLLLFRGPHPQPNPFRNGALRLDERVPAAEMIRRGRAFFAARASGFVVWSREHADADLAAEVEREGFRELERIPGVVLEGRPKRRALPEGVELREALDERARNDLLQVIADAWGLGGTPLALASDLLFHPGHAAEPHTAAFVAYEGATPISGGMAMGACGVVVGCQGGTIAGAGGRGLAQITFGAAVEACMDRFGASRTLMHASSPGLPVWLQLGFVAFTGYRRHLVPP